MYSATQQARVMIPPAGSGLDGKIQHTIRLEFVEFVRLRIEKKILVTRLFSCKLGFKSDIILGKHRCNNKTGTSLK